MSRNLHRVVSGLVGLVVLGCQGDQLTNPIEKPGAGSVFEGIAVRLEVDVVHGTVRELPPPPVPGGDGSLRFAILGANEVGVSAANFVTSPPVNNRVTVTFDAAITNRLTSASLLPSTLPTSTPVAGLLLFPFDVTQATGGSPSSISASTDWNGDGTSGGGAPRNFFNDFGCPAVNSGRSDCYRWEQYPAPLGPGETSAAQRVGFSLPKTVTSFQVMLLVAADIGNDLPAVHHIVVTPSSYVMNDGFPKTFTAMAYDDRNNAMSWPSLTWTTADITALEFQYGGALVGTITGSSNVVHGRKVGQTSFTVSSGGVSVVVPVDIQMNTVALVQAYMLPDSELVTFTYGQASASVKDHSGQIIPLAPTWSSSDTSIATVDPASGLITAWGVGTSVITATAAAQSGSFPLTVIAGPTGFPLGKLTDLDGGPIRGADITATGANPVHGNFARSSVNGTWFFPGGLLPDNYRIDFDYLRCVPHVVTRHIDVVAGQRVTLNVAMDCQGGVSGNITSVGGPLPAGLTFALTPQLGGPAVVGSIYLNTFGIMAPDGDYTLTVQGLPSNCTASGPLFGQVIPVRQQSGALGDVTIDCAIGSVTGMVRDYDGQPVSGARVLILGTQGTFTTSTNASGQYTQPNLPPGSYLVGADNTPFCSTSATNIIVGSGPPTVVSFNLDCPATLHGMVTTFAGGPIPSSGLTAQFSSAGRLVNVVVSAGGAFTAELPGSQGVVDNWSMSLLGAPSTTCRTFQRVGTFTVLQQQTYNSPFADFTVDCRPTSVQVIADDGGFNPNPQPMPAVQVEDDNGTILGYTDMNGSLVIQGLPLGNQMLWVKYPSPCSSGSLKNGHSIDITNGSQSIHFGLLCDSGALEGTIRSALGAPLAGIRVVVGPFYVVTTDANGHWGVANLPPGPLVVVRVGADTPAGCAGPQLLNAAVAARLTIPVNETVVCSGF